MKNKSTTYSVLTRSAWLALMVFMVVFSGPVKKMIELQMDKATTNSSSSQNNDKKLRTWYREKREIAPLVQSASHQSSDDGIILFLVSSFISLLLLSSKRKQLKPQYDTAVSMRGVPLYLHCRRLLV